MCSLDYHVPVGHGLEQLTGWVLSEKSSDPPIFPRRDAEGAETRRENMGREFFFSAYLPASCVRHLSQPGLIRQ
jgi:hypothetical protein